MSASNQATGPSTSTSTDNFTTMFNVASTEYQRVTGKRLDTHPFAAQLDTCDSPGAVSDLLRTQAQAFSKFRKSDEKLMAWLDPTVHILSATLGEGIGLPLSPAKTIFTAIGILLEAVRDVAASHRTIMHLFERIHLFLQRLNRHTGMPLTDDLTEILGKIMAQLLTVLALSTKAMADKLIKKFLKKLARRKEVEDAILRLDALTKEESMMTVARNSEVTYRVDGNVETTRVVTEDIDDNAKVTSALSEDIDGDVKVTKTLTETRTEDIDDNVKSTLAPIDDIEDNVKVTEDLSEDIEDNMKVTEALTEDIDNNVKVAETRTEDIDDNVKATEALIEDIEGNVKVTKDLSEDIDDNMKVTEALIEDIGEDVNATKDVIDELKRNQLREKFRTWLSPPNPSINHNAACEIRHDGTATWFIQGNIFRGWKENGSLLWIRGIPGAGKSILCSAVIEDIKNTRDAGSALIAYYYFDYKDPSKRDIGGLLASLIFQLSHVSDRCWDVLYQLYIKCKDGYDQPSTAALEKCLENMLKLPEQLPIFIILDALDECPNTTETPSARENVLKFVINLVGSGHSNLSICVTSHPEQDIQSVLNPLTSPSRRVSLHEEAGQREDINRFLRSFVQTDSAMRRWKEGDKELVINMLSERANGIFRWVCCQLDTLRRCMPSSIRKVLNELPTTLDDTYERVLQGIPKEKHRHAHRGFQCLVAAIRPLRIEELAEIFAIDFDQDETCNFMEGWRPEDSEEAVLSMFSTLISVVEHRLEDDEHEHEDGEDDHGNDKDDHGEDEDSHGDDEDGPDKDDHGDDEDDHKDDGDDDGDDEDNHGDVVADYEDDGGDWEDVEDDSEDVKDDSEDDHGDDEDDHGDNEDDHGDVVDDYEDDEGEGDWEDVEDDSEDIEEKHEDDGDEHGDGEDDHEDDKDDHKDDEDDHENDQGDHENDQDDHKDDQDDHEDNEDDYEDEDDCENRASRIVQFSHFSVEEFLTSERLRMSEVRSIRDYHVPLDVAHTVLARACLAVVLHLDENAHKKQHLETSPLVSYAARHWVEHAKYGDVASRVQSPMEELFNPKKRHLAAWISIRDVARDWYGQSLGYYPTQPQSPPGAAALFYAAFCGLREVADYLVTTHAADVNAHYGDLGAPLHMASGRGHAQVVHLLLQHHADVDVRLTGYQDWTPLCFASYHGHAKVVRLLLEHGADVNVQSLSDSTPLWFASEEGHLEVVRLLLGHGADVHIRGLYSHTPLQRATDVEIARLLLGHGAGQGQDGVDKL